MCLFPNVVKGKVFPCRKCVECRLQYSEEWARRIMLEAKEHEKNCFITLTYNEDNLPERASLKKRDFQKFMKRFRKQLERFAIKVRYFACGEYGSKSGRPHYHAIIFGWSPDDAFLHGYDRKGNALYRSPLLEKCWKFGFSSVGFLTYETAKYCAKYMQGDIPRGDGREAPFTLSSRRPGIALGNIPDTVYKTGDLYFDGKRYVAPRAFLQKVEREFPEVYEVIKYKKLSVVEKLAVDFDLHGKGFSSADDSIKELWAYLCENEEINRKVSLEVRRKKYKKIFGNSIDNRYRPVVSLKRRGTMRKSRVLRIVKYMPYLIKRKKCQYFYSDFCC